MKNINDKNDYFPHLLIITKDIKLHIYVSWCAIKRWYYNHLYYLQIKSYSQFLRSLLCRQACSVTMFSFFSCLILIKVMLSNIYVKIMKMLSLHVMNNTELNWIKVWARVAKTMGIWKNHSFTWCFNLTVVNTVLDWIV